MELQLKDKVLQYRKAHKMTQKQFAEKLGISRSYYSNLEIGLVKGNVQLMKMLVDATDKGFEYWADINTEANYKSLSALEVLLDSLIDANKVSASGKIDADAIPGVLRIVESELLLKLSKKKER